MNRKIKFRAWDKMQDKMIYKFTVISGSQHPIPMQFTGLLDKLGKEIYEGDIVNAISKERYNENRVSDIIYNQDTNYGEWQVRTERYSHGLGINWGGWESIEVIGNIFENKNLLK